MEAHSTKASPEKPAAVADGYFMERMIIPLLLLLCGCANKPRPVMMLTATNSPMIIAPTHGASDTTIAAMVIMLRDARMEAGRLAAMGCQMFEVRSVEEVSSAETDYDFRGLPTGTFTPRTNWVGTLVPAGTNKWVMRGASKDGSTTLIFRQRIIPGTRVDINIRHTP